MSNRTVSIRNSIHPPHPLAAALARKLQPQARVRFPELFKPSARERRAAKAAAALETSS